MNMKKFIFILFFTAFLLFQDNMSFSQCSICTKTVQQLGDKPAKGFNSGIIYLMLTPFAIMGYVGYRWFKQNKAADDEA
jgi:hypothetical protein